MHSDNEYDYYKVPVSNGTTLVEGTVPYTCEKGKGRLFCHFPKTPLHSGKWCIIYNLTSLSLSLG